MRWICISCLLLVFFSCGESSKTSSGAYFDLNEFMRDEAKRLQHTNTKLQRTLEYRQQKESKIIDRPDWLQELAVFSDCDLNKPALKDAYRKDTLKNETGMQIGYHANDDKQSVRFERFVLVNGKCVTIDIHKEEHTLLYISRSDLHFAVDSGFAVSGMQKILFSKELSYRNEGLFLLGSE